MAYYHPCKNCAVDAETCSRRAQVRDAIAGLHITSVKFKCKQREQLFRPGQRVKFTWSHWEQSDYDGSGCESRLIFSGTVVAESGTKFTIRVDAGKGTAESDEYEGMAPTHVFINQNLVVKVKPVDMWALDEPDIHMCPNCLAFNADEANQRCHGFSGAAWDVYHPQGCLVDKSDLK